MKLIHQVRRKLQKLQREPRSQPGQNPQVSVLVVTYNGRPYLGRFLSSLTATRGIDYELIVVDNASRRPTRSFLVRQAAKGVIRSLTLLNRNTLFSPGVNTALRVSEQSSPYVLLLNPDVVIRNPDWLRRLLAVHQRGATSLGYVDGNPWSRADGYCLLLDRDLFSALGGLSEEFHWWWAVTKLQADLLRQGHAVQAVVNHEDFLRHIGGGSGRPPADAKGMRISNDAICEWFDGRRVTVLDSL